MPRAPRSVVEMARRLARCSTPAPPRRLYGLLGRRTGLARLKHYVEHPLFPLSSTIMMINFDMVGRLNQKNELTIYGTGTTPGPKPSSMPSPSPPASSSRRWRKASGRAISNRST